MSQVTLLIDQLKQSDQDHEFYPTTNEIIRAMVSDLKCHIDPYNKFTSVLDIGAGNGKVLMAFEEAGLTEWHAIEKSSILCAQLDRRILIVGTEFAEQSLLSKEVDVIFSNPPYSQFEQWAEKIIRQAASHIVYLVIPRRWQDSTPIADALKFREVEAKVVREFDFEDAEDRQARAKVHLLRIKFEQRGDDAFDRFFREQFADLIGKFEKKEQEHDPETDGSGGRTRPFHKLVPGPTYPDAMVALYRQEMENIERNYKLVSELDVELLREFEIFPKRIMECLKKRLSGLRNDYWAELFSRLNTITDRLTSGSRKKLLETLHKHCQVDFTVPNICEIVLWVIKNANQYIEDQLIQTYELMVDKCNVQMYKSNQRTWVDDRWRYGEPSPNTHFLLDYRIVTHRIGGVASGAYSWNSGLNESASTFLGDLMTLARNLGFHCHTNDTRLSRTGRDKWKPGERQEFFFFDEGKQHLLFDVRGFKNRNLHLRLNTKFMLALNVEHGRLQGWLKSAKEAQEELNDPKAAQWFKANTQIGNGNPWLLLGQ